MVIDFVNKKGNMIGTDNALLLGYGLYLLEIVDCSKSHDEGGCMTRGGTGGMMIALLVSRGSLEVRDPSSKSCFPVSLSG